jgi:hypothetical protein
VAQKTVFAVPFLVGHQATSQPGWSVFRQPVQYGLP